MKKILLYLSIGMTVLPIIADSQQKRWNQLAIEDKMKYYLANAALYPTVALSIALKLLVSQETAQDYIAPMFDPIVDELVEKTRY
jgi:hypothetical protein